MGWKPIIKERKVMRSLNNPLEIEEVWQAIDKSKCGKSGWPTNGITTEVFKCLRNYIAPILLKIFNKCIQLKKV